MSEDQHHVLKNYIVRLESMKQRYIDTFRSFNEHMNKQKFMKAKELGYVEPVMSSIEVFSKWLYCIDEHLHKVPMLKNEQEFENYFKSIEMMCTYTLDWIQKIRPTFPQTSQSYFKVHGTRPEKNIVPTDSSDPTCVICKQAVPRIVFVNCGHVCMCYECAEDASSAIKDCPVCRTHISSACVIYPPS